MKLIVRMEGVDTLTLKVKYLIRGAMKGLKEGTPEAANLFVEEARALVPVDTGNLRDHIHAQEFESTDTRYTMQVAPFVPADNKYGFDPAYARRIEYGFFDKDSLGRDYHQAAQPYMRPAFDNKQDEAAAAIKESVYTELDAAMASVAARRR